MRNLYSLLFIFLSSSIIAQCNLYELSIDEKVNSSTVIFEGEVKSSSCFWNEELTLIYTSHTVEVFKIFKGELTVSQLEVITKGGIVGDKMIRVHPSVQLEVGDVGLYTVNTSSIHHPNYSATNSYVCYGSVQGFFQYDLVDRTASVPFKKYNDIQQDLYQLIESIVKKTYTEISFFDANERKPILKAGGSITSFSPTTISAGTKSVITINGSDFGASQGSSAVQFKNADDGGATYIQPQQVEYISWSDTKIQVEVPDAAGTGTIRVVASSTYTSSTDLTVPFAETTVTYQDNIYHPDHVDMNSSDGLTWQMHTDFDANTAAKEAILRALNTWRCATNINWSVGTITTVNSIGRDGTSVIRFDSGSELSAGVLGTCYSYYSGCSSSNWYVEELDLVADDGGDWEFGPASPTGINYDFESTMLHELGHGHQLLHVIDNADVMNYGLTNASSRRALNASNTEAGNDVMSRSIVANSCSPGPMVALTGQCAIGAPAAEFSATPLSGCADLSVDFTDNSTENPTSWAWDIDNNGTTDYTTQYPSHVYPTAGNYTVQLIVSNGTGIDTIIKSNYIAVNPLPDAGFTNVITGADVSFTNTSIGASTYNWNFDDTNSSGLPNPSNTYSSAGTYTVTLIATNSCGNDTADQEITIGVNGAINKPNPDFTVNVNTGCSPLSVNYTDISTENPSAWSWDIDNDGTEDYTTQNPSHVYTNSGTYTVKLIVTNGIGSDSITKTNHITIDSIPDVGFSNLISIDTVMVTNTSTNATSYTWSFGDGSSSTTTDTSHVYSSTGTYTVSLIASNGCGADTVSQNITIDSIVIIPVVQVPVADFSGNTLSGCAPLTVVFTDLSTDGPTSWEWDIDNNGTTDYTTQHPSHVYTAAGNYTVRLKVLNSAGADSITKVDYIFVDTLPVAGYTDTINAMEVAFTNSSINAISYTWSFGDSDSSTQTNTSHTYTAVDTYTVTLTAVNACGNNEYSKEVVILGTNSIQSESKNKLRIYPNPTTGTIQIELPPEGNASVVEVFNYLGERIELISIQTATNQLQLDLSTMDNGMYCIVVQMDGESFSKKVILIK